MNAVAAAVLGCTNNTLIAWDAGCDVIVIYKRSTCRRRSSASGSGTGSGKGSSSGNSSSGCSSSCSSGIICGKWSCLSRCKVGRAIFILMMEGRIHFVLGDADGGRVEKEKEERRFGDTLFFLFAFLLAVRSTPAGFRKGIRWLPWWYKWCRCWWWQQSLGGNLKVKPVTNWLTFAC